MAVEKKRGCGYRKVNATYIVSDALGEPCHRLPLPLSVCPTCKCGVKPARGWTWVAPAILGAGCGEKRKHCRACVICTPSLLGDEPVGLLWIGASFYPTPEHFMEEASRQGVSRRIARIPRGFVAGQTWVLMAHREAIEPAPLPPGPRGKLRAVTDEAVEAELEARRWTPGIITCFRPKAVELILRRSDATPSRVAEEAERGVRVVVVPDGDPDHDPGGPSQQQSLFGDEE